MSGLRPVLDLFRSAWLRLRARHLNPMAPADMHLEIAIGLADSERWQQ